MRPRPVTLREILGTLEPWRIAKFIHSEVPIRTAERLRSIEELPGWQQVPELVQVHDAHLRAFCAFRAVERRPNLDAFTRVVREAVKDQKGLAVTMAKGLQAIKHNLGDDQVTVEFVDRFLDRFLLNRIGSNVLMTQYLACLGGLTPGSPSSGTGIVDPACNAVQVCEDVAEQVLDVCQEQTNLRPFIRVEAQSAVGEDGGVPKFPYIPSFLKYIVSELLKNSCKATSDAARDSDMPWVDVQRRPIAVVVCADERRVTVRISDRARGIPFHMGSRVWSYMYTSTSAGPSSHGAPTELAGYGLGLPMSRLYARYLGGSLDLVSLPGYGTDAYLVLPRLEAQQLEVIPQVDCGHSFSSLADYCL